MLKIIKEYIDAKLEYERYGLHAAPGLLSPSNSLTEAGQQIRDRYLAAERAMNEAIYNEEVKP